MENYLIISILCKPKMQSLHREWKHLFLCWQIYCILEAGVKNIRVLCFAFFCFVPKKHILKQIRQTTHLTKHHGEMNIGIHKHSPSLYAWLTVWWQKSICLFKKAPLGIEECRAVMVYCLECLCLMTNRTGIDSRELYSGAKMIHVLWLFPSPGFAKLHLQNSASISLM